MTKAVTKTPPGPSPQAAAEFTADQVNLIRRTIARGATDDELQFFLAQCRRTRLDPFLRQIFAVKRWDSRERREILQTQVSIDGLRLVAQRSGLYAGQTQPEWCGPDGRWVNVWLSEEEPPAAARIGVLRSDFQEPCYAVARYGAYYQAKKEGGPNAMWARMPDVMLSKCAEALALRKSFPQEMSGLYADVELAPVESEADPPPAVTNAPADKARPSPFEEMITEFSRLKARLAPDQAIYYEVLAECGVRHSNEFRNLEKARVAYSKLKARVRDVEAARQAAEESEIIAEAIAEVTQEEESNA